MGTKLLIGGIIVALLVGGALFLSGRDTMTTPDEREENRDVPEILEGTVPDGSDPFIGSSSAPVTINYWLDFQCPFCKRFEQETLPTIIRDYVETGKVKVVFRDFPFIGAHSQEAALVARAVWELYPGDYYEWQRAMFSAQDGENSGFGDRDSIFTLIEREFSDMDVAQLATLLTEKESEYRTEQNADRQEGESLGFRSTPGFTIGTQRVTGAQPISVFSQVIENELAK